MKKNMTLLLVITFGLFVQHGTLFSSIDLPYVKRMERRKTIHRSLAKETIFDSCTYNEEFKTKLECLFAEQYYTYDEAVLDVVALCLKTGNIVWSPSAREMIQTCVKQHGTTASIIAIAGMTLEGSSTFFIVPAENGVFFLSIPGQEVQFLNEFEEKIQRDELMGQLVNEQELIRYNLLASLIHAGLRIISEMDPNDPHVCAYNVEELEDVSISYNVKKR